MSGIQKRELNRRHEFELFCIEIFKAMRLDEVTWGVIVDSGGLRLEFGHTGVYVYGACDL